MNAQWIVDYLVKGPTPHVQIRGSHPYRDGDNLRGSVYLSSPDFASAKRAHKRCADTVRNRLVKAGAKRRAVVILSVRCVG